MKLVYKFLLITAAVTLFNVLNSVKAQELAKELSNNKMKDVYHLKGGSMKGKQDSGDNIKFDRKG